MSGNVYILSKEDAMGWGRTLLLGDIGNRLDIEDTERDIANLRSKISRFSRKDKSQDEQIIDLANENAELKLYLAALIRLLTAKGAITPGDLETMVNAVDAEDGQVDGRFDGDIK